MKTTFLTAMLAAALLFAGCGQQPPPAPAASSPTGVPVTQPVLIVWEQGDKAAAVSTFVATDWKGGPLFPASSPLSLTEDQFKKLSQAERETKSAELLPQLEKLKKLAVAVTQAGRTAVATGDTPEARKHFTAVQECGAALDTPHSLAIAQLVGRSLKKMAAAEMTKLAQ